ncbi:DUF3226 domain-containing protein [Candidatus Methylacidiphilum fumarolicum]|uniref:DUF3226 domain-containing protein n=1 Tax=Candidatus Methylacidiphilum fumarolicum TaxID=591154 RepID=UPI0027E4730F|nr:DUF3226 domain-containing protein [Candidatus Methylacidiphilum fumarolicum]
MCEGEADEVFLKKLGKNQQINEYEVRSAKGIDKFPVMFNSAIVNYKDITKPNLILFIADAGADPKKTFENLVAQLSNEKAVKGKGLNFPMSCCEVASNKGYPAIKIHLLPDCDKKGSLETLCYKVMKEQHPEIEACIRNFAQCTNIEKWSPEQRDKAYVQCFIASTYHKDPNKSLRYYLQETNTSFNFNHEELKTLVEVIRNSVNTAKHLAT